MNALLSFKKVFVGFDGIGLTFCTIKHDSNGAWQRIILLVIFIVEMADQKENCMFLT